jgi:Apea-like HEPN
VADAQETLIAALHRFVDDAVAAREEFSRDATVMRLMPGVDEFAARLASLRSAGAVDRAALEAARANGYLRRKSEAVTPEVRAAGRHLTGDALADTGVAGLLLAGGEVDAAALVKELAGYLAGPQIPMWDYAIIDADVTVSEPVPVVDGWELVTPTSEELAGLEGIPSGARHLSRPSFRLDLYGGLTMLRRIDAEGKPRSGLVFNFDFRPPAHALWQPLLALSLYQNPVLQLWARYRVEPGRRVDVLFDRVYTEPWTPDGVREFEVVRRGDYEVDASNENRFRHFFEKLSPLLAAALAQQDRPTKAMKERAARLRRIAEHFLTASEDAHGEGEVLSELNADAVLHYAIALEAVLAGGDSDKSDLTRKVVQRAAVIAGTGDQDRLAVAETVRSAYAARSAYAHGSEPRGIDLPALRRVVRDCLLARLVLGDPTSVGGSFSELADSALLDHSRLAGEVRGPISEFWESVAAI